MVLAKQRGVWKRIWQLEQFVPRLTWKTGALCEGQCVYGKKRGGLGWESRSWRGKQRPGCKGAGKGAWILFQRTRETWKAVHGKIFVLKRLS